MRSANIQENVIIEMDNENESKSGWKQQNMHDLPFSHSLLVNVVGVEGAAPFVVVRWLVYKFVGAVRLANQRSADASDFRGTILHSCGSAESGHPRTVPVFRAQAGTLASATKDGLWCHQGGGGGDPTRTTCKVVCLVVGSLVPHSHSITGDIGLCEYGYAIP